VPPCRRTGNCDKLAGQARSMHRKRQLPLSSVSTQLPGASPLSSPGTLRRRLLTICAGACKHPGTQPVLRAGWASWTGGGSVQLDVAVQRARWHFSRSASPARSSERCRPCRVALFTAQCAGRTGCPGSRGDNRGKSAGMLQVPASPACPGGRLSDTAAVVASSM
jgi:hypothetical protein